MVKKLDIQHLLFLYVATMQLQQKHEHVLI